MVVTLPSVDAGEVSCFASVPRPGLIGEGDSIHNPTPSGRKPRRFMPMKASQIASCVALAFLSFASRAVPAALGQEPPVVSGEWTATTDDGRVMRGRWIGQAFPGDPDSAHGSWTFIVKSGKSTLSGTWSAHKTGKVWRGTWSAQPKAGKGVSGTWSATLPADSKGTFRGMLELTISQEVEGSWRSGRLSGSWWLRGKPSLPAP